mgnify:CR=1 FL=1
MTVDLIKLIYELSKKELSKHVREANVYWVSDLVRCLLKRDYEIKYPELGLRELFTPAFIYGSMIHRGLQSILKEIFADKVMVEVESSKEIKLPGSSEKVVIKGRADAILVTDEGNLGIEIKTSRSDMNLPHDHHVDQVMIYNWLFNLKYSLLIYITPDRVTQYEVLDRILDSEVADRVLDTRYPRYPWECNYCAYSVLCPYKKTPR